MLLVLFLLLGCVLTEGLYIDGIGNPITPDYATVQEAIDAASTDDRIIVTCGTYDISQDILQDKRLTISGWHTCKPIIRFTHGCANWKLLPGIIGQTTFENLEFTNIGEETDCVFDSKYTITTPVPATPTECYIRSCGVKINNCAFNGVTNGVLIRSSGAVEISYSSFMYVRDVAIDISYSSVDTKIHHNTFQYMGEGEEDPVGIAIRLEPTPMCVDCDRVMGEVKIEDNELLYAANNFILYNSWCNVGPDCKMDILKIKNNNIGYTYGPAILFNDPQCSFPFTFQEDKLEIEDNVFHHVQHGIIVDYKNATDGEVPDDDTIVLKNNEFCYVSGGLTGVFFGFEQYAVGYTTTAPLDASLSMFKNVDNSGCMCHFHSYTEDFICSEHGECLGNDHCECDSGYTGPACGHSTCPVNYRCHEKCTNDPMVCNGHGDCLSQDNCQCDEGWDGTFCTEQVCDDSCYGYCQNDTGVCCGNGLCTSEDTCECNPQWEGDECCVYCPHKCFGECPGTPYACNGNGDCIAQDTCHCKEGWNGTRCGIECEYSCHGDCSGALGVCGPNGMCVGDDECQCTAGWAGAFCNETDPECLFTCYGECPINACSGHGVCTDIGEEGICTCEEGWIGDECDEAVCPEEYRCDGRCPNHPDICEGHGACIGEDQCDCHQGWVGDHCTQRSQCSCATDCYGRGACDCSLGYPQCICGDLWDGNNCETSCPIFVHQCDSIRACHRSACSSHGICAVPERCVCEIGYWGENCQSYAENFTCYGKHSWQKGVCSDRGICVAQDTCVCLKDHEGNDIYHGPKCNDKVNPFTCNGFPETNEGICCGHGECVKEDTCACSEGYGSNKPGSVRNQCCDLVTNYTCCGHPPHDPETCSRHGHCVGQNLCECYGEEGEDPVWHGRFCESKDQVKTCFEFPFNSPDACTGHGVCISDNICECAPGWHNGEDGDCRWGGPDWYCHGVAAYYDHLVCSGNGDCQGPDVCTCDNGFYGVNCQSDDPLFKCNGISWESDDVCSGHGNCLEKEYCNCTIGWIGPNCDNKITCKDAKGSEFDWNEKGVCSGHGECVSENDCECNPGWMNNHCSDPVICNGIPAVVWPPCGYNDNRCVEQVCSGHGECTGYDECTCQTEPPYSGQWCDNPDYECFGVFANQSNVCYEQGECVDIDTCDCDYGYIGRECELPYEVKCIQDGFVVTICYNDEYDDVVFNEITSGWVLQDVQQILGRECVLFTFTPSPLQETEISFHIVQNEEFLYEFVVAIASCENHPLLKHLAIYFVTAAVGFFVILSVVLLCVAINAVDFGKRKLN